MSKLAHSNQKTMDKIELDRRTERGELSGNELKAIGAEITHKHCKVEPVDDRKGLWLVMDGRARFDTDRASIMECIGQGRRNQIPRKAARKMWADHDAVLVFCPDIPRPEGAPVNKAGYIGPGEYVVDVDPPK